jgi:WD40 repeat protein
VGQALVHDFGTKETRLLETHGSEVTSLAWDPEGQLVVTGSRDGTVRAGPATGEEPHLLFGHTGTVHDVAVDPAGRWIASAGEDGTVRLWPLPLPERPFHTLPYPELLDRLRSLTNFRVVPDPAAAGGYRLGFERFVAWDRNPPSW